jgi:hypothetical protein
MEAIEKVTKRGTAVICTIHQPSTRIFLRMTHLLLLEPGGKEVYFGQIGDHASTVLQYFEQKLHKKCPRHRNPADFLLSVSSSSKSGTLDLAEVWQSSEQNSQLEQDFQSNDMSPPADAIPKFDRRFPLKFQKQLWVNLSRFMKGQLRNPRLVFATILRALLLSVVLGTAFIDLPLSQTGFSEVCNTE